MNIKKWEILLLATFLTWLFLTPTLWAQGPEGKEALKMEEVVVTATRTPEKAKTLPVATSVITKEEIKATGFENVADLLRYVEGFYIQTNGGPGRLTNLKVRGLDSRWVMVMIDGMEVNDPSAIGGIFDFSDLAIDDIERIEIIRGPESPLYGSDAMAGVVNIITERGRGKPSFSLSGYTGSMDTWETRFSSYGKVGVFDYSLSTSHMETNGIGKDDRYWRRSYALKVGGDIRENLRLEGTFRFIDGDLQYDDFDFKKYTTVNDPNQWQKTSRLIATLTAIYMPFDWWESQLKLGMSDTRRKYDDKWDAESTDHYDWGGGYVTDQMESRQRYMGRIKKIDWQNTFYLLTREKIKDTLVAGYEYREDEAKSTSSIETATDWGITEDHSRLSFRRAQLIGYYAQNQLVLWNSLNLLTGIRVDDPDDFGGRTTYNLGASYYLKATGTTFKARYATGFKAPTIYELYAPPNPSWWFLGGNRSLVPEEGESYEMGISQSLFSKRLTFDFTFFHEAVDKKILWYSDPATFQSTYKNISTVVDQGVEMNLAFRPWDNLLLKANYTYTNPEDREHHRRVERVPLNQWNASLFYTWKKMFHAFLSARFVGDRVDRYSSTHPKVYRANSYTVVNGKISYQICPHFQVFIRGENIFNRQYEEVKGYQAPDASCYIGGKVRF